MTKKVLSLLVIGVVSATLVGCGIGKKEEVATTNCEGLKTYMKCVAEKSGQDVATVEKSVAAMDEEACQMAVEDLNRDVKKSSAMGCDVPPVIEKEVEVKDQELTEKQTDEMVDTLLEDGTQLLEEIVDDEVKAGHIKTGQVVEVTTGNVATGTVVEVTTGDVTTGATAE